MIGQTIKDLRKSKKMSQTELATILHVSQQTITAWETGKAEPSSSTISSLADYFNVTTDYLLKRKTQTPIDLKKTDVLSYDGKPVSNEDLAIIRAILERNK